MPSPDAVAYLILAHEHPGLCRRLVDRLTTPGAHCFVHLDARTDRTPFDRALAGTRALTVLDHRVAVRWGGFSVVRATLRLLTAARRAGPFSRYALLSGVDTPLRPAAAIVDRLLADDREWMQVRARLAGPTPRREDRRILRHHLADLPLLDARARPRTGPGRRTRRLLRRILRTANGVLGPRRYPAGFVPYLGCQWWCLSDACVAHVLRVVAARPDLVRFHRTVFAPDEIFFHSIVKASPFAARLSHDHGTPRDGPRVTALHYVDWHGDTPRVLDERDYDALRASPALFARKLEPVCSRHLLTRLDADLAPPGAGADDCGSGRPG